MFVSTNRLAMTSAACLAALAILGVVVAHGNAPYGFENPAIHLVSHPSTVAAWSDFADVLGTPTLIVAFVVCLGIGQAKGAGLRVGLYALLAVAAILISDHVVKPLVDRTYFGELTFPSGHVTAATAAAFAMWLALFPLVGKQARNVVLTLGVAWVLLISLAVVAGVWHTPLDVVGAVLLAIGVVSAGAAFLESPGIRGAVFKGEGRPRTRNEASAAQPSVEALLGPAENPVGVAQAQGIDQEKG
jgi:membrane-associated phospholipid phosphatase